MIQSDQSTTIKIVQLQLRALNFRVRKYFANVELFSMRSWQKRVFRIFPDNDGGKPNDGERAYQKFSFLILERTFSN